ncbi:MAG TPA: DUF4157 domain-containing protein [Longimicrobium sp.]|nr:DUF4157 domain-containing protein [Longimicrobium sp.]
MAAPPPARPAAPPVSPSRPAAPGPRAPAITPAATRAVHRCGCGGGCPACRAKEEAEVHRKPLPGAPPISTASGPAVHRCGCGGTCAACRAKREGDVQRQARPAAPSISSASGPAVHRCGCGGTCAACRAKREGDAQRQALPGAPPIGTASAATVQRCGCGAREEAVHRQARDGSGSGGYADAVDTRPRGPGRGLDPATRAFMEPRFGRDFGAVRLHTGPEAARSARGLDARAFTIGQDIYFGEGEYSPRTQGGRRLLAHELTHTVQQSGATSSPQTALRVSRPGDALELEAERVADAVTSGARAEVRGPGGSGMIQRQQCPRPERSICCEDPWKIQQVTLPNLLVAHAFLVLHPDAKREYAIPGASPRGRIGYADLVVFHQGGAAGATVFEIKSEGEAGSARDQVGRYIDNGPACTGGTPWQAGSLQDFPHPQSQPLSIPAIPSLALTAWWHSGGVIAYSTNRSANIQDCDETPARLPHRALPHALIQDYIKEQYATVGDWLREYKIPTNHPGFADLVHFPTGQRIGHLYEIKRASGRGESSADADRYLADANRFCLTGRPGGHRADRFELGTTPMRAFLPWPPEPGQILEFWTPRPGWIFYNIHPGRRSSGESRLSEALSSYYGRPAQPAAARAPTGASASTGAAVPSYVLVPEVLAAATSGVMAVAAFAVFHVLVAGAGVLAEAGALTATAGGETAVASSVTGVRVVATVEGGAAATQVAEAGLQRAVAQPEVQRQLARGVVVVLSAGSVVLIPGTARATRLADGATEETRDVHVFRETTTIPQSFITTGHPVLGSRVFVRGRPMRIAFAGPVQGPASSVIQAEIEYPSEDNVYRWQLSCVGQEGVCGSFRDAGATVSEDQLNEAHARCSRRTGYTGPVLRPTPNECANLPLEGLWPGQQGRALDPRFDR